MSDANTKREHAKILELARDYRSRGYQVVVTPHDTAIPSFLRSLGYLPDLIVTSKRESYVIEVSSHDTAQRLRDISSVVEAIEKQEGWEFVLVMTNPREPVPPPARATPLTLDDLQIPLADVKSLAEISANSGHKYAHAVLLAAWAVIEAALRMYLYSNQPDKEGRSPNSIVRDAVMYGFITAQEGQFLDSVVRVRNVVAHGALTTKIPDSTLIRLLALCDALARDLSRGDA